MTALCCRCDACCGACLDPVRADGVMILFVWLVHVHVQGDTAVCYRCDACVAVHVLILFVVPGVMILFVWVMIPS